MQDFLELHNNQTLSDIKFESQQVEMVATTKIQENMHTIDRLYEELKQKEELLFQCKLIMKFYF
jgi:hypothetical protein